MNRYCGLLFVGHCTSDALVEHFLTFINELSLDTRYLLHIGMDGPNVNLAFSRKLDEMLSKKDISFLNIGTCSLHPVHTAFINGLSEMDFNFDYFFHDLSFFFHQSSSRREDFVKMESFTGVVAEYVLKHGPTRWLSMKYVAVRAIEQLPNIKEYFLTFLPEQKNFAYTVKKTARYNRIITALKNKSFEAYLGFMIFFAHEFERFLRIFQYSQPMIHILYPESICLLQSLMTIFTTNDSYSLS